MIFSHNFATDFYAFIGNLNIHEYTDIYKTFKVEYHSQYLINKTFFYLNLNSILQIVCTKIQIFINIHSTLITLDPTPF